MSPGRVVQRSTVIRFVYGIVVLTAACLPGISQSVSQPAPDLIAKADALSLPDAPLPNFRGAQQQQAEVPPLQQQPAKTAQTPSGEPSLADLGMSPEQTKADPDMQARLDRRSHDLKVHQKLGIITLATLAAACISSAAAPPDPRNGQGNTVGRDIHVSLGSLSVSMYALTAYYAIKAPRIPGEGPAKGGIKLHKYLIYIHAPGMILTPILGAMAFNQAADGERVHGIASAHGAVAWTTVAAYSASILAVSWPLHLPGRKTP